MRILVYKGRERGREGERERESTCIAIVGGEGRDVRDDFCVPYSITDCVPYVNAD